MVRATANVLDETAARYADFRIHLFSTASGSPARRRQHRKVLFRDNLGLASVITNATGPCPARRADYYPYRRRDPITSRLQSLQIHRQRTRHGIGLDTSEPLLTSTGPLYDADWAVRPTTFRMPVFETPSLICTLMWRTTIETA